MKMLISNAFVGSDAKDTIHIEPTFFQRAARNVRHWVVDVGTRTASPATPSR
jgi:hypothetical protein